MIKKDNIAVFPLLINLPIIHGFSWGQEAPNMSEKFSNNSIVEERIGDFLTELGVINQTQIIRINPTQSAFNDPDILEITSEILKRGINKVDEVEVGSNAIFTSNNNFVLTITPADCAICILYFENNLREKFVGLIHCSARETDKLLPEKTINHLKENYLVNPKSIKVGITPAISKEYFSVREGEINEKNWGGFMEKKNGLIYVDIVGNVLNQLSKSGLSPENIQFYGIDTFSAALEGKTFSHRLSRDLNLPEGRYIVVVGLK